MPTTAKTVRAYRGPALFSYGFRPFFLGGAIWGAASMILFMLCLGGDLALPSAFSPIDWHVHELLYGFLPAILAGFLLTAVPNWTGRLPVAGVPLAALFTLWLAGRAAVAFSIFVGPVAAGIIDTLFLAALGSIVAREILASKNLRNLKVLVLVTLLGAGNLIFHAEAVVKGSPDFGKRIGIAAAILLITLIGGRIVPSFTRNWLAKSPRPWTLPAPFGFMDIAAIASAALALLAWTAAPETKLTGAACVIAGVLQMIRLVRWKGYRTAAEPLVFVLHAGYFFVPAGFLLMALAITRPEAVPAAAAIHLWTVGAIGLMTLAIMSRASLGHTGRPLKASKVVIALYASVALAAAARVIAALGIQSEVMLWAAALGWILAFGGFAFAFGPMLLEPRKASGPPQ